MYKLLVGVLALAAWSYGGMFTINLNTPAEGFSHDSASLIRVNLDSYTDGATIESAYLQFTGIQNTMEPETVDKFYYDLVELNSIGGGGQQNIKNLYDGPDNENTSTNYFTTISNVRYDEVIALGSYTDNNDNPQLHVEYKTTGADWEDSPEYKIFQAQAIAEGKVWKYRYMNSNYTHVWEKVTNGWVPEDFIYNFSTSDISALNEFKSSTGLTDGWIGIGIDADCHYLGNISLVVNTTSVPEPTLLSLLGCGLLGLFLARRKNSK